MCGGLGIDMSDISFSLDIFFFFEVDFFLKKLAIFILGLVADFYEWGECFGLLLGVMGGAIHFINKKYELNIKSY